MILGRYINYLKYVLKHKYYVFIECTKYGLYWQGLIHDLSKFKPSEFIPYAKFFYEENGEKKTKQDKTGYYKPTDTGNKAFDIAWLHHQNRNPHHWQYWIVPQKDHTFKTEEIPEKYILEMIADWKGASIVQGFGKDVKPWYKENKDKMILHPRSREIIESII